ncbi:FUSC family protein [Streptomyces sp. ME01-24h]|nr:FUSC family protein [Streptomyces sp. ME19-03-3]MDX3354052.1 FUSC family protein [Streptomyces sp. ME01-24h]
MASTHAFAAGVWDRLVASDPGLLRLQHALSTGVAISTAIGVQYGCSRALGSSAQDTLVAMLLGAVVALTGCAALGGPRPWSKVRTAVFFPVAILAGMLPGAVVAGHPSATFGLLVALLFLTVYIRRFGPAFSFYGTMSWIGFVFAEFLQRTVSQIPALLLTVAISSAWVLLLSLTVLRVRPVRTLRRMQQAFGARARAVARACWELLESSPADADRHLIRLRSRQLRLTETALVIDGWSASTGALPDGWSAATLRRRTLEAHLVVDDLAAAAVALSRAGDREAPTAAGMARNLARNEYATARLRATQACAAAGRRASGTGAAGRTGAGLAGPTPLLLRFAEAALAFTGFAAWDRPPPTVDAGPGFTPAASLVLGGLPGSSAVARGVAARAPWSLLRGLPQTSRQALQAAVAGGLAIVFGRLLSPDHYYWAVAAAILAFAGTATSAESVTKAGHAVVGTLLGLGAGAGIAEGTAGHPAAVLTVIVVSLMLSVYLAARAYAFTAFFATTAVVQLYSLLHELSRNLLLLRLEETTLGAAIGVLVALLILRTDTRDTVEAARGRYFDAVADVLRALPVSGRDGAATRGGGDAPTPGREGVPDPGRHNPPEPEPAATAPPELDALLRALDLRTQQLSLVAAPLTSLLGQPVVWGNDPRRGRHRLALHAGLSLRIRAVAAAMARDAYLPGPGLARAITTLADAAEALGKAPPRAARPAGDIARLLADAQEALPSVSPRDGFHDGPPDAVVRALTATAYLLGQLASLSPSAPRST